MSLNNPLRMKSYQSVIKGLKVVFAGTLVTILFTACLGQSDTTPANDSRPTEVSESYSEFPQVSITNNGSFNFDYYVTSTKISESITDNVFQKELAPKGKYLVVEFSAMNKGATEEFGNLPLVQLEYNGKTIDSDLAASAAEEDNIGLKSYTTEKVKPNRKGKYVKVFDLENYDANVKTAKLNFNLEAGKATGSIEITVPSIVTVEK